uniref:Protein kinase putative n=1 Tax=Albugo laibachii Nc14 TaxID=890382 RepID=F0W557_9STRA|nr:protein kinase putative [Albugo laibachii Nc14]|eukprot:CCA16248.1 protein kinase putative [Albugo laibachii Nc14]
MKEARTVNALDARCISERRVGDRRIEYKEEENVLSSDYDQYNSPKTHTTSRTDRLLQSPTITLDRHNLRNFEDSRKNELPSKSQRLSKKVSSLTTSSLDDESTTKYAIQHLLSRFDHFQDSPLEESYQIYTSFSHFPIAQRILGLLLVTQLAALFISRVRTAENCANLPIRYDGNGYATVSISSLRLEDRIRESRCLKDLNSVSQESIYIGWAFSPLALIFAVFPFKILTNNARFGILVYWTRRYWKTIITLICLVWVIGWEFGFYLSIRNIRKYREYDTRQRLAFASHIVLPKEWYEGSVWDRLHGGHSMRLLDWIVHFESILWFSIELASLAALSATASVLVLTMKLGFSHALCSSVLISITTLVLLIWCVGDDYPLVKPSHLITSQAIGFVLGILLPLILCLMAIHSEDRVSRIVYLLKIRADRLNIALKLDLCVKHANLANRGILKAEQEMLDHELISGQERDCLLNTVAIPFRNIKLFELVTSNRLVDILLAEHCGKPVIFKRLSIATYSSQTFRDFRATVETVACLRHPNIVLFIGATFNNLANIGLIFEYLEHGNVYSLLHSSMSLTWNDPLLKIATDVAQGMSYLHNCDTPLVHRDIKSSNLLCSTTYTCKISDFDESKRQNLGELLSTVVGTAYWLAPEVLREEKYDAKVDCYSFGIVMIELETRKDPYHQVTNLSPIEIMIKVATEGLRPDIPATCSPTRRHLIERCLNDSSERRPAMTEILHILQNDIRNEILQMEQIGHNHENQRRVLLHRHQRLNRRRIEELLDDNSKHIGR